MRICCIFSCEKKFIGNSLRIWLSRLVAKWCYYALMFLFRFILTFKYFSIFRYSSYSNLSFGKEDLQTMIKEVGEYKNFGGDTLVEVTTCGIKPDFEFLKKVAEATGVNIVCGTGYYLAHTQTEAVKELDIDSLVKVNYLHVRNWLKSVHIRSFSGPYFLEIFAKFFRMPSFLEHFLAASVMKIMNITMTEENRWRSTTLQIPLSNFCSQLSSSQIIFATLDDLINSVLRKAPIYFANIARRLFFEHPRWILIFQKYLLTIFCCIHNKIEEVTLFYCKLHVGISIFLVLSFCIFHIWSEYRDLPACLYIPVLRTNTKEWWLENSTLKSFKGVGLVIIILASYNFTE